MALLDRIHTCHHWHPDNYRPFIIGTEIHGHVTHEFARKLSDFSSVFETSDNEVRVSENLTSFDDRSIAVESVIKQLVETGDIPRWRDEYYPITNQWGQPPLMKMDRGAAGYFGIRGYGVHVNGIVKTDQGLRVWVGKRSMDKPNAPGKLDHIVAGGQPFGLSILENLIKEAEEEADIPKALAQQAKPTGLLSYRCERDDGLRNDVLFTYDLYLPESFTPQNTDGEVEEFYLWPLEQIIDRITNTDDFKFNVSLATIHFLIREGHITPDSPDYTALVEGMHRQSL
ncbi:DUF4743 domain-containing protein [Kiloniella sp.]|uniref:DUF4743 domain-containing protein n=1 Tax=Kiloniella sp. TaxID=1938587 RepID=UPI003B01FA8A